MGTFYRGLSLGYFLSGTILGILPSEGLSFQGIILWLLSSGVYPWILLGNYPWGSFYQGLSLGALSFSPPIKGLGVLARDFITGVVG